MAAFLKAHGGKQVKPGKPATHATSHRGGAGPLRQGQSRLISFRSGKSSAESCAEYKFGCVAIKAKSYIRCARLAFSLYNK
jgi:hypothetical protein